jgi:dTDP-4-amino-4,6-dideoxygalactose transaminase
VNFSLGDLTQALTLGEGSGDHKVRLRKQLASFLGLADAILTPSGRAGLYAILKAIDQPKVLVPAYTCNAVVEAATLAGKQVIFIDSSDDFNMPSEAIGDLASQDTVVLATHQFGFPCDVERMVALAHDRGALVVEDAAASLGSRIGGRLTGTFADAAFFSFDISKLITVPLKGGAIVARDSRLLDRIRKAHAAETEPMPGWVKARLLTAGAALIGIQGPTRYRLFHRLKFGSAKFTDESPTLNLTRTMFYRYEFANWQAAIASRQMDRIEELCARRRAIYAAYRRGLSECRGFSIPPPDLRGEWAPIRFPITVSHDKVGFYREAARRGVDFAFSFTFIAAPREFGHAHALADSVLDLPFFDGLRASELEKTIETLVAVDRTRMNRNARLAEC